MKKIIALCLMLFGTASGFSQIKVMEVTRLEKLGRVGTNDIYVQKEGNQYTFYYKNTEFVTPGETSMRNFTFKNLEGDYEGFYKIIADGFVANPLNDIKLELPNDFVWLHYVRGAGNKVTVQFMTSNKVTGLTGVSVFLTYDDIKKLFEKA